MVSYAKSSATVIPKVQKELTRVPEIDISKCIDCELCVEVCPQNVFARSEDRTYRVQHGEKCIECGACVLNCRGGAISFEPFPGCGCIWNATSRRLKSIISWRKTAVDTPDSCCGTN